MIVAKSQKNVATFTTSLTFYKEKIMNYMKPTLLLSVIAVALLNAPTVAAQNHH
jgi:hypothetical protein